MFFGVISSSYGRSPGTSTEIPSLNISGGTITASYIPLVGELNKPPYVTDLTISGTVQEGQTLTATLTGGVLGPFTAGTHLYQWYRLSALYGGTLTAISGATASTYLLTATDVSKFIVCAARFVQVGGGNTMSPWFYSIPTVIVAAGSVSDIPHPWEDKFIMTTTGSIPSNWNDTGVSPNLINLAVGGTNWTTAELTKPTFSVDKLVFAGAHKVTGTIQTFPPVVEFWVKAKFTANSGTMIGWGSQTILGITSGGLFYVRDTSNTFGLGDLNEHVFRVVLNGATSIFQVDGGIENVFTSTFTSATTMALGQTFSGANTADCEIKELYRTADGTVLTTTEVADKWTYHGF